MLMQNFREFATQKERDARKHLEIVKKMFEHAGMKVVDRLKMKEDPYIFIHSPEKNLSFEGVRVYQIGNTIAFRIQREADTHPYGKAYPLNIQAMFEDLLGEDLPDEKIAQEVMRQSIQEVKSFFEKSAEAEKSLDIKKSDPLSRILARSSGTDYSSTLLGDRNEYR